MAIDYGNYVQLQGQGVNLSPLQEGVQRYIDRNEAMNKLRAQNLSDNQWQEIMNPFQQALTQDVQNWDPMSFGKMDAGKALEAYKLAAGGPSSKTYQLLAQTGEFNPVAFKQKYDQLKASYMPMIEQKLSNYKMQYNLSDKDMKGFVTTNPELQRFILDNADPAGVARDWAIPHTPEGFIGGAIGEVTGDPVRYGFALGGFPAAQGAIAGGYGAYKAGKPVVGAAFEGAKKGLKRNFTLGAGTLSANPELRKGAKGFFGKGMTAKEIAEGVKKQANGQV